MPYTVAFIGFPDDRDRGVRIAPKVNPEASEIEFFEDTVDGVRALATYIYLAPKRRGDDFSKSKIILSTDASPSVVEAIKSINTRTGIKVHEAPVPARMTPGSGYRKAFPIPGKGETIYTPKPAPSPVVVNETIVRDNNPLVSGGELDSRGFPPYMERMDLETARRQEAAEIANASFSDMFFNPHTQDNKSYILWITGVSGGSGKTTLSYLVASILANAMRKSGQINTKPVYLIEADFDNSKWASRLDIPRGQDLSHYVQAKRNLNTDVKITSVKQTEEYLEEAMDNSTFITPSGLRVIACPYDIEKVEIASTTSAVSSIISQLTNKKDVDPIIIVDGGALSVTDPVALGMARKAHAAILTDARGNRSDINRSLQMMTREMSIPVGRISIFFMKCNEKRFIENKGIFAPYDCVGFLPFIPEFDTQEGDHGAWVGNLQEGEVLDRTIINVAQAIENINHFPEVSDWIRYSGKQKGVYRNKRRLFGRKRK